MQAREPDTPTHHPEYTTKIAFADPITTPGYEYYNTSHYIRVPEGYYFSIDLRNDRLGRKVEWLVDRVHMVLKWGKRLPRGASNRI
jgi:hypothetical protein